MAQPLHLLIVGALAENAGLLMDALRRNDFDPSWERVDTAEALSAACDRREWDLVLASDAPEGFNALAALEELRQRQVDTPLILVCVRCRDDWILAALRAGAQGVVPLDRLDYLAPIAMRELRDAQERRARRQAQAAWHESQEMYRILFERAGDAIFVADATTGQILDANQRACALVGRSHAELCRLHQQDLYPPGESARYAEIFAAHLRGDNPQPIEAQVRHAMGYDIPVEISTSVVTVSGRAVVLGIFRDIRERKEAERREAEQRKLAEEAAHQQNRQLRILNELGMALAETLDLDEVYRTAYEQVSRLTDADGFAITLYEPEVNELRPTYVISDGQPIDVSIFPPIVMRGEPLSGRARAVVNKEPEVIRHRPAASGGSIVVGKLPLAGAYIPMIVKGKVTGLLEVQSCRPDAYGPAEVALLGPAANQIGLAIENARLYAAVQRELNERKRAEESLRRTLVELTRSNADLEQYAYVAAHDLQEPLRMVASFVQLLAERYRGQLDADADDFIGFAVEGAKRMQTLINNLLEYSLVDRSNRPFRPVECEMVLAEALRNLEYAIAESGAHITYDPLPTIVCDAPQLQQVFENLIGNAIKFRSSEPPRIHISAQLRPVEPAAPAGQSPAPPAATAEAPQALEPWLRFAETTPEYSVAGPSPSDARGRAEWLFSVRDNGIGIEPQYAQRIFRLFQRLHSRREYSGTGIGLAICKKVIERHGGRIWVESQLGAGATFYFTLPANGE